MRLLLRSEQSVRRAAPRAHRAGPPCRRGPRSRRASARPRPSSGAAASASATSWLPSSWTPARPSRTASIAAGSPPSASRTAYGDQRPGAVLSRQRLGELLRGGTARPDDQGHLGTLVVGLAAASSMPSASAAERVPQRGDHPPRMGVDDGEMVLGVLVVGRRDLRRSQPSRSSAAILRSTALTKRGPPVAERHSAPARRWPRPRRAWGCGCRAVGGRQG